MKIKLFLFTVLLSTVSWIFGQNTYSYKVDLVNIKEDKVAIELQVPKLGLEKVFFNFPKVIPGTYANKDYGRFISDFLAYDSKGVKLNIKKKDNLIYTWFNFIYNMKNIQKYYSKRTNNL